MPALKKKSQYNVAIVGATGAVGLEFLNVITKRKFPIATLKLFASPSSVGKKLRFKNTDVAVELLTNTSFHDIDIAFFSAGGARSKEFAALAVQQGAIVIDNSSAFRMDPDVPLIVPEVNPNAVCNHQGIIANPNCTTIIMATAIFPIHQINPIKRIIVSSYQAVSGAGAQAVHELHEQQRALVNGQIPQAKIFPHVIANNLFSHNSPMTQNGYNEEEMKMIKETQKIFEDSTIEISPTCIRVPIDRAHAEAIHLELTFPPVIEDVMEALNAAPGIKIAHDPQKNIFPMPSDATGQDNILVGRVRLDPFRKNCLNLFVCGDQLLKGAALNAVQIAEHLITSHKNMN